MNPYPPTADPAYEPAPMYAAGPDDGQPDPRRRRSRRRTVLVGLYSALIIVALGGPLGLLWHVMAPTIPVIDAGGRVLVNDPSPEEYIAAEGWFTLLGFAFGLVVAVVAWLVMRRDRGPGLLLGVAAGMLGAAPVAWQIGRQIGLGAYERWRHTAASGSLYHAPPDLHAYGTLLVPAFAAVIVMTLLAGWSNDPDLDEPGALPGYGNNQAIAGGPPVSSGWPDGPGPTGAPAPPGPGPAGLPRE